MSKREWDEEEFAVRFGYDAALNAWEKDKENPQLWDNFQLAARLFDIFLRGLQESFKKEHRARVRRICNRGMEKAAKVKDHDGFRLMAERWKHGDI